MSIFKLRPLACGCFLFLVCLCFSYFLGNAFAIALITVGALLLAGVILWKVLKNTRPSNEWLARVLPSCICLILCGIVALSSFASDKALFESLNGTTGENEAKITQIRYSTDDKTVALAKDKRTEFVLCLYTDEDSVQSVSVGDTVKAEFLYGELENALLGYSERDYYLDKGIFLYAEAEKYEIISGEPSWWQTIPKEINAFLDKILEKALNSDTYSLVSAMLLGNKSNLDGETRRDFSRLGISHILALSGIHISLITALFGVGLDALRLRRSVKCASMVALICSFVCITGFSESAMRAGIMLILFYTLSFLGTESDSVTCLFSAVAIICAFEPYAIFSTSLILSFSAMLGCLCSVHYTKRVRVLYRIRPKILRGVVYSFICSVTVVLFTLPIVCVKFDYVSVFAPIFNVFFVPLLSLLLYLAPFVLLVGWIPYLSYLVTVPAELITKLSLFLTKSISKADFLTVSFSNVAQYVGVVIILLGLVAALVLSRHYFKYVAIILATGVLVFGISSVVTGIYRENSVSVSTYGETSRDIVAVESENEVMIIEMSRPSASSARLSAEYALYLGYAEIDTYVITDYSDRIADAIDDALSQIFIRKILLPCPVTDTETELYEGVCALTREKGIKLELTPQKYDFGRTSVDFATILPLKSGEKRSVIFKVNAFGSSLSYLGAGTHDLFSDVPENYVRGASVVIFGAYGNRYYSYLTYDLSKTSYVVFNGVSQSYMLEIPDNVTVKPQMHRFVFK